MLLILEPPSVAIRELALPFACRILIILSFQDLIEEVAYRAMKHQEDDDDGRNG